MKQRVQPVVLQPATYQGLQKGINQIAEAVRPTLGPLPRHVAIAGSGRGELPELLDNGAVIARRIISLPDRDADMGAMLLRQALWRVHEAVGDGTATTAVLFRTIYNEGVRYIASGGNAMKLRYALEHGLSLILDYLNTLAAQVEGQERLAQVAEWICYDPPLAHMLGEIFDIIGEYGEIDIRLGNSRQLEREYVEGIYWESGVLSRYLLNSQTKFRVEMQNAAVLISDLAITSPQQLIPVLDMAREADIHVLLIVAKTIADSAISLLLAANRNPSEFQVVAVKTPGMTAPEQFAALEDMALLTGGRPLIADAGDTLEAVKVDDLGRAGWAWADQKYLSISDGQGDARQLRQHIATLRRAYEAAEDAEDRKRLRKRIGKLMGGSATLWVGGMTKREMETRKAVAERTAEALRGAVREGIVPGGGAGLLVCQAAFRRVFDQDMEADERAACRILSKALEAPIRAIITNAGHDASEALAEMRWRQAGPQVYGFDVRTGCVVNTAESGLWDTLPVIRTALTTAVTSAALALTIDVLVHHKNPERVTKP